MGFQLSQSIYFEVITSRFYGLCWLILLKPLRAVAFTAKNLKVLQFRTSACGMRKNMVYRKAFYLLSMGLTYSFTATKGARIGTSLVNSLPNRFQNRGSNPTGNSSFCIQHMLCAFFLLDMNDWFTYRARLSSTRKFQMTGVTDAALLSYRVAATWLLTKHHYSVGFNHKTKVAMRKSAE